MSAISNNMEQRAGNSYSNDGMIVSLKSRESVV